MNFEALVLASSGTNRIHLLTLTIIEFSYSRRKTHLLAIAHFITHFFFRERPNKMSHIFFAYFFFHIAKRSFQKHLTVRSFLLFFYFIINHHSQFISLKRDTRRITEPPTSLAITACLNSTNLGALPCAPCLHALSPKTATYKRTGRKSADALHLVLGHTSESTHSRGTTGFSVLVFFSCFSVTRNFHNKKHPPCRNVTK